MKLMNEAFLTLMMKQLLLIPKINYHSLILLSKHLANNVNKIHLFVLAIQILQSNLFIYCFVIFLFQKIKREVKIRYITSTERPFGSMIVIVRRNASNPISGKEENGIGGVEYGDN